MPSPWPAGYGPAGTPRGQGAPGATVLARVPCHQRPLLFSLPPASCPRGLSAPLSSLHPHALGRRLPPRRSPTRPVWPLGGPTRWRDWWRQTASGCQGRALERGSGLSGRVGGASSSTALSPEPSRGSLLVARAPPGGAGGAPWPGLVLTTSPLCSCRATDGWSFWRRPCGMPPGAREVPPRSPIPRPPRSRRTRAPHPAGAHASSLQATCLLLPSPSHLCRPPCLLSPCLAILETTLAAGAGYTARTGRGQQRPSSPQGYRPRAGAEALYLPVQIPPRCLC